MTNNHLGLLLLPRICNYYSTEDNYNYNPKCKTLGRYLKHKFSLKDTTFMISKNSLKYGLIRRRHAFPFSVSDENSAVLLDRIDICLSLCIVES